MFDKNFLSLYFSEKKISLISLDSKRKKVIRKLQTEIPSGIIEGYTVKDVDKLAEVVKKLKNEAKTHEKSAGLIIPEYTTFSKVISVPSLGAAELNEAVRWEAQEFLPKSLNKLILDWKILKKVEKETKVLVAAIDKEVLAGYVEAAEAAGLLPLAVETPSLSLSRFIGKGNNIGRLIIYGNREEFLFIVANGETIYGTTIAKVDSVIPPEKTATRMCQHYKDADVSKITLSGVGISEKLVVGIRKELKLDIEWINPKIGGLTESEVQEYIVPICLQFSDLEDPEDQKSLNLLPSRLVDKYKKQRSQLQIWGLSLTVTLFVWISLLLALGSYFFLNAQVADFKRKNAAKVSVSSARENAVTDSNYINNLSTKVLKIKKYSLTSQEVIDAINSAKPPGVEISDYNFSLDLGKIEFEGVSTDRPSLIKFKDNLELNKNLGNVNIPISSFEKDVNVDFVIAFDYLPVSSLTIKK